MSTDTSPLTPQQRAAIELRESSIALAAGAGCGKTFVLTRRFLSHLEPGPEAAELSKLVAITFTERAAREMRERIRQACRAKLQNCAPEHVDHWLSIVRQVDSARISTIHSFCATLLRSYAVEARIDPRFGLLDPAGAGIFLHNAVTDAVHERIAAHDPDALELVLEFGLDRAIGLCETFVLDRFKLDFATWGQKSPDDLVELWNERFTTVIVPALVAEIVEARETRDLLNLLREHSPSHDVMRTRCDGLLEGLPRVMQQSDPLAALADLVPLMGVKGGGNKKAWSDEEVYESVRDGLAKLKKSVNGLLEIAGFDSGDQAFAAGLGLATLRTAHFALEHYTARKREAGLLDFDDLLLLTRNLLRDHPQVQRRAQRNIDFLLVDEFQDTDPVQADIVRFLCGERLVNGKLFLVGDSQQSIYRFRRADPAVFHALRNEIPPVGRLPLSMNFRSQPAILRFVNALFAETMGPEYEPLVPHLPEQLSPPPVIEFLFATPGEEDEDSASALRQLEAEWIARRLHQMLHDGVPRVRHRDPETGKPGLRPLRLGDIVLLFRAMSDVRYYEAALRKYGLDYYLVGGRAFFSQQEVYDLVSLFQFLDDEDDEISLLGVLRSPFFSLSDDTLYVLVRHAGSLRKAISAPVPAELDPDERQKAEHALAVLNELREQKDRLPLAALFNLALERTGFDAALLTEFLGSRKLANLRKLIDMARTFDRSGLFTLSDFVMRLRESITEETDEELAATHAESSDVIRLMTIHQSKGLEFPLVVLCDMERGGPAQWTPAVLHGELGPLVAPPDRHGVKAVNLGLKIYNLLEKREEEAETVRLFYVAATRAADHLILSGGVKNIDRPTSPWLKLLADRFELSTGRPRINGDTGRPVIPAPYCDECPMVLVHQQAPPEPRLAAKTRDARPPLETLRDAVESAEPAPLPRLMSPLPVSALTGGLFSVSQLEVVDAVTHAVSSPDTPVEGGLPVPEEVTAAVGVEEKHGAGLSRDAERVGTLVHSILERIDFANPGDYLRLIDRCWEVSEELSPRLRAQAEDCLRNFFSSPCAQTLGQARRLFRELEFQLRWPRDTESAPLATITGTIDCLYETVEGEWVLLDYKTVRTARKRTVDLIAEYELQLGCYAFAAKELLGRFPDRIELVLLRNAAESIRYTPTTEQLATLEQRVTQAMGLERTAATPEKKRRRKK